MNTDQAEVGDAMAVIRDLEDALKATELAASALLNQRLHSPDHRTGFFTVCDGCCTSPTKEMVAILHDMRKHVLDMKDESCPGIPVS